MLRLLEADNIVIILAKIRAKTRFLSTFVYLLRRLFVASHHPFVCPSVRPIADFILSMFYNCQKSKKIKEVVGKKRRDEVQREEEEEEEGKLVKGCAKNRNGRSEAQIVE